MRSVLLCLCAALLLSSCGKKGNPLPPLVRLPAAPGNFAVSRIDDRVYVRFTAPAANIDGVQPADVARVEVFAITLEGRPPDLNRIDLEELRERATLVAVEPVRRPQPPPPPVKEGMPPIPVPPPPPGVDQGAPVVVAEVLTPETRTPVTLEEPDAVRGDAAESSDAPRPLVAPPPGAGLQRYYVAFGVSPRGRYGPPSPLSPSPLGPTSGPPSPPRIEVTEDAMTLTWTPPADARGLGLSGDPDWLPARPVVPGPMPTTYDVYETTREGAGDGPVRMPTPLTEEPIGTTEFRQTGITLGKERCFYVRAVDIVDGLHVRGPASPVACASFADTFAPAPPSALVAVAVGGGVNLIWDASDTPDVKGYLVLRGEAGSATLTPLNREPVTTPSYRDETAAAGVRYVYAVVAVDGAGNRSPESNRVEETAQ